MTMRLFLFRLMKIAQTTASFVFAIPSVAFHALGQRRYNDDHHHADHGGASGDQNQDFDIDTLSYPPIMVHR